jgi:hypothetical protein
MRRIALCSLALAAALAAAPAFADCAPEGWTAEELAALRASGFKVEDDARRNALALALVDCLGDPDPQVRDGLAFEGLSRWMRGDPQTKQVFLTAETVAALREVLQPQLTGELDDPDGVRRPFVALVMAEVARTDRIAPWLTPEQRAALVADAAAYLAGVRDYRGFVDGEGWRHGVAHGSDLALQLALNEAVDRAQLDALLAALRSQVVADGGHAYIHGEPGRLARAVFFIARRDLHDAAFWETWLKDAAAPGELGDWGAAFGSEAGLARLHDTREFMQALLALTMRTEDAALRERLQPALLKAMEPLP